MDSDSITKTTFPARDSGAMDTFVFSSIDSAQEALPRTRVTQSSRVVILRRPM